MTNKKNTTARFSETKELDRNLIELAPEKFQGRQTEYSEDTVSGIVSKGIYDKSAEPIIVWKDRSNDKFIILSGHSRFEAAKRLFESGKQKNLSTIPVKEFFGTEEEAIDYATLESNRGSTEEGLISDLNAYRRSLATGKNKEYLKRVFKPESKLKKLQSLSFLDPKGFFIEHLASPQASSFPYLERNSIWVGQLRDSLPALTNAHESEIFKYIYAGKKKELKRDEFMNLIDKRVNRIDFDQSAPLNLENLISSNAYTDPLNEKIKEIDREIDKLQKEIERKRDLIVRAKRESKEELIPKFQTDISDLNQVILRKIEEKDKIRAAIGKMERETVADLFSVDQTEITLSDGDDFHAKSIKPILISTEEAAKKKATGNKFTNTERKAASEHIRKIVEEETAGKAELTQEQVLSIAKRINENRSLYSQIMDAETDSRIQRLPTEANLRTWAKNPGGSDILGVDSAAATKPTLRRDLDVLKMLGL